MNCVSLKSSFILVFVFLSLCSNRLWSTYKENEKKVDYFHAQPITDLQINRTVLRSNGVENYYIFDISELPQVVKNFIEEYQPHQPHARRMWKNFIKQEVQKLSNVVNNGKHKNRCIEQEQIEFLCKELSEMVARVCSSYLFLEMTCCIEGQPEPSILRLASYLICNKIKKSVSLKHIPLLDRREAFQKLLILDHIGRIDENKYLGLGATKKILFAFIIIYGKCDPSVLELLLMQKRVLYDTIILFINSVYHEYAFYNVKKNALSQEDRKKIEDILSSDNYLSSNLDQICSIVKKFIMRPSCEVEIDRVWVLWRINALVDNWLGELLNFPSENRINMIQIGSE